MIRTKEEVGEPKGNKYPPIKKTSKVPSPSCIKILKDMGISSSRVVFVLHARNV